MLSAEHVQKETVFQQSHISVVGFRLVELLVDYRLVHGKEGVVTLEHHRSVVHALVADRRIEIRVPNIAEFFERFRQRRRPDADVVFGIVEVFHIPDRGSKRKTTRHIST